VCSNPFDECFDITHGQVNNDMLNRAHYLMKLFSLRYSFRDLFIFVFFLNFITHIILYKYCFKWYTNMQDA
jgi:hypothetical protein